MDAAALGDLSHKADRLLLQPRQSARNYPIGYFHIEIAEVWTTEGKLYLFMAIERTSKFAIVQRHAQADRPTTVSFLHALIEAVPYRLHTILTDNGI